MKNLRSILITLLLLPALCFAGMDAPTGTIGTSGISSTGDNQQSVLIKSEDGVELGAIALDVDDLTEGSEDAELKIGEMVDGAMTYRSIPDIVSGMAATLEVAEFTSSGTWSKPAGVELFSYIVVAAGGGGGGSSDATYGGGGGGGGEVKAGTVACSSAAADITITVPGAADGGTGAEDGDSGGSASIGSYVTSVGGEGGDYGKVSQTRAKGGGPKGADTYEQIGNCGGFGGAGSSDKATGCAFGGLAGEWSGSSGYGKPGGGSYGNGADYCASGSDGNSATGYGGGGNGAGAGTGKVGGDGAPGYVLIWWTED